MLGDEGPVAHAITAERKNLRVLAFMIEIEHITRAKSSHVTGVPDFPQMGIVQSRQSMVSVFFGTSKCVNQLGVEIRLARERVVPCVRHFTDDLALFTSRRFRLLGLTKQRFHSVAKQGFRQKSRAVLLADKREAILPKRVQLQ